MFIKGAALAAEELTSKELEKIQKGDTIALGFTPDGATAMIVVRVKVTSTTVRPLLVRIEGYGHYNHKRVKATALLFTNPEKLGEGYAELLSYS